MKRIESNKIEYVCINTVLWTCVYSVCVLCIPINHIHTRFTIHVIQKYSIFPARLFFYSMCFSFFFFAVPFSYSLLLVAPFVAPIMILFCKFRCMILIHDLFHRLALAHTHNKCGYFPLYLPPSLSIFPSLIFAVFVQSTRFGSCISSTHFMRAQIRQEKFKEKQTPCSDRIKWVGAMKFEKKKTK